MIRTQSRALPSIVPARALAIACVLAAGGCGSGGVDEVWIGEPYLVIGEDQGVAADFGRVSGLTVDEAGRIFAADGLANEVRAFSPTGEYLFTVGGPGRRSGELSNPCCLAVDSTGRLWVRDNGNQRYSAFALTDLGGRIEQDVRMSQGDATTMAPLTFDSAGHLIDIGARPTEDGSPPRPMRLRLTLSSQVFDSVPIPVAPPESLGMYTVEREIASARPPLGPPQGPTIARFFMHRPYAPTELQAHGPGGAWAYALSSRYAVDWYDAEGRTLRTLARPDELGPELTVAESEEAARTLAEDIARLDMTPDQVPFELPTRKPPLRSLFFDLDGRLWIELSVLTDADRRAHVYAPDGRLLFTAQWPAAVRLTDGAIRGDQAIGVVLDAGDVERVVGLRFERD